MLVDIVRLKISLLDTPVEGLEVECGILKMVESFSTLLQINYVTPPTVNVTLDPGTGDFQVIFYVYNKHLYLRCMIYLLLLSFVIRKNSLLAQIVVLSVNY